MRRLELMRYIYRDSSSRLRTEQEAIEKGVKGEMGKSYNLGETGNGEMGERMKLGGKGERAKWVNGEEKLRSLGV